MTDTKHFEFRSRNGWISTGLASENESDPSNERGGGMMIARNGVIRPLRFSTDDFPERDRVAMWRELFGRLVARLDIEPLGGVQFRARQVFASHQASAVAPASGGPASCWPMAMTTLPS
jgi:hypothetical protein